MGVHGMFFKTGSCFDEMRLTFFSTWDAEAILEQQPGSQGPPCSPPCSPKLNLRSCESGMQVGCLELFRTKTLGYWELTGSPNHRWKHRCSNECPLALLSLKGTTAQRPFFKAGGTLTNKQPPWIKNLKLLPQKHYRVPRNEKNHQKIKNHRNMILNPKTCPHFSNWSSWSSRWTTFLRKKSRRVMG